MDSENDLTSIDTQNSSNNSDYEKDLINSTWNRICDEVAYTIKSEPILSSYMNKYVLSRSTFKEAIVASIANDLSGGGCEYNITSEGWSSILFDISDEPYEGFLGSIEYLAARDLEAYVARDPACELLSNAFLYYKGFKSITCHRFAHVLWKNNRQALALTIQSLCCNKWDVDVHPACVIGGGFMIDHATGLVIGETAVIGNDCSFLHGVTLGSTGKEKHDRHPKVGNGVLIGCNATILGNIVIGDGAKIGSGSIVLKPVCCKSTVVGNPAKVVGRSTCNVSGKEVDHALMNVQLDDGRALHEIYMTSHL